MASNQTIRRCVCGDPRSTLISSHLRIGELFICYRFPEPHGGIFQTARRIGDVVLYNGCLAICKHHLGLHLIPDQDENDLAFSTILLGRGSRTPPEPGRVVVGLGKFWASSTALR